MRVRERQTELKGTYNITPKRPYDCSVATSDASHVGSYEFMRDVPYFPLSKHDKPVEHFRVIHEPFDPGTLYSKPPYGPASCGGPERAWYGGGVTLPWVDSFKDDLIGLLGSFPPPNPSREDVWEKVVNPFGNNFVETALEISSASAMLKEVRGLINALRQAPKSLHRLQKVNPKKAWQRLVKAPGAVSSAYLSSEFGWQQAGEDVARLLAFTSGMRAQVRKLNRLEGKTVRMGFTRTHTVDTMISGARVTGTVTTRVTYRLRYKWKKSHFANVAPVLDEYLRALTILQDYWGLRVRPKTAWDIVPGSWLLDQVLPVGDLLSDLPGRSSFGPAAMLGDTPVEVTYEHSVRSWKADVTVSYPTRYWVGRASSYWDVAATPVVQVNNKVSYYKRTIELDPPPVFSIRDRDSISISNTGIAYLVVLGTGRKAKL